jgi:hypothetical protein
LATCARTPLAAEVNASIAGASKSSLKHMQTAQKSFDKFCLASSIKFDWTTPAVVYTILLLQQWAF